MTSSTAPTAITTLQPNPKVRTDDERCPYCGGPISGAMRARIASAEAARLDSVTRRLKDEFAREVTQAESKKNAEIDRLRKTADQQIKRLRANQDALVKDRVQALKEDHAKKMADALAAERTKAYAERMQLDARLHDLQRQLQRKTADELGGCAEVELFEALKAEFPGDQITRVAKGVAGADIIHKVVHNGVVAGTIIYDSKNHRRWQNQFTAKLRQDQIGHGADHAVLSSGMFPAGARQLHLQDGVIVVSPARVLVLAHILRRHVVQVHALRLGNRKRTEKAARLYDFITSDRACQMLDQIGDLTADMLELDARETNAHRATWKRRGELIRAVQGLSAEFSGEVERIIGTVQLTADTL